MNDPKITHRNTHTCANMMFTGLLAAGALIAGLYALIAFIGNGPKQYLTNAVYSFAISFVLLLLCLILANVRKNGKPFSAAIIWKLRIIAVIIVAAGCMPSYVEVNTSDNIKIVYTTVNFQNFFIIALGVIVGIISQIFVYGHKLQEDNDLIA